VRCWSGFRSDEALSVTGTDTKQQTGDAITLVRLFGAAATSANPHVMNWDDIYVNDGTRLGPACVDTLCPTADTADADWTSERRRRSLRRGGRGPVERRSEPSADDNRRGRGAFVHRRGRAAVFQPHTPRRDRDRNLNGKPRRGTPRLEWHDRLAEDRGMLATFATTLAIVVTWWQRRFLRLHWTFGPRQV
jgi:hypothetical protein